MLVFSELAAQLAKDVSITLLSDAFSHEISEVELLDGRQTEFCVSTLYIGFSEQVAEGRLPPQCILGADDKGASLPTEGKSLAVTDRESVFFILNEAGRLIRAKHSQGIYAELMDIGGRFPTFDRGINTCALRVGNPLVLLDADASVLSCSTTVAIEDDFWRDNIRRGSCSYSFRTALASCAADKNTVIFSFPDTPRRMLISGIVNRETFIGYSIMVEQEARISPIHMELLPIIAAATGEIIARYAPYLMPAGSVYGDLMYDLLTGVSAEDAAARISALSFPPRMCAICVKQDNPHTHRRIRNDIPKRLSAQFPELRFTALGNDLAAILPLSDGLRPSRTELAFLTELAEGEKLHIGLSDAFFGMERFAAGFAQAARAIELLHDNGNCICIYGDCVLADLLGDVKIRGKLESYRHPALTLLKDYDTYNETEYCRTLGTFLAMNCSVKDATEALYIHRNTMDYRLARIKKLTGLDITERETRFRLELSYRIDEYLNADAAASAGSPR